MDVDDVDNVFELLGVGEVAEVLIGAFSDRIDVV